MCLSCHGAPGKVQTEMSKGLNPQAPDLAESSREMTAGELFWITKNGIKMTGMPAWGLTHTDDKIWPIVAFIKKLPEITGAEYDSMEVRLKSQGEKMNE